MTEQITPEEAKKKKGRWRGMLSKAFARAADIAGRSAVTGALKIGVTSALVGAGASAVLTIGTTALATGAGAALYSYGKDYLKELRQARSEGRADAVSFWDAGRAKRAHLALLAGVAGGAFGSWFAGTETFQSGIGYAKDVGGKVAGWLGDMFNHEASAPVPPETVASVVVPAPVISESAVIHSPQELKDMAHNILRDKNITWTERLKQARELATQASARGNH